MFEQFSTLFIIIQQISVVLMFDVPCTQKLIGGNCLFDEECYGVNTVCRDGRCTCPTHFEEYDVDGKTTVCRLAPSKIGDSCQRDCKPPLLCRDGKCECWGGSIINGKCVVPCPFGQQLYGVECKKVANWGHHCEHADQCIDAFNQCISGICQCTPGTSRDLIKQTCIAMCPDGMLPKHTCRRLFLNDIDMLENAATTDSCPQGYRCVTYGSPYVGHCCKLRCPYGEPDLTQSCDKGTPEEQHCRPLTHDCYTIKEPGWKSSLCCPKPCRDPTPLYIDNKCLSFAYRDDPCQIDQQCEGGVTMSCILTTCQCKLGFQENNDGRFPTCEKTCSIGEIAIVDKCLPHAQLDEKCVDSRQCPNFSECQFGTCQCICGFKRDSLIGARCTNPDDPFSLNAILSGVEEVLGGRSNGK